MKFKVPWSLLPLSVIQFSAHSLLVSYENHYQECSMTKYKQFSKCCLGEISSQCATISRHI